MGTPTRYLHPRRSPNPDRRACQACFAVVGALSRRLQHCGHLVLEPRETGHATDSVVWQESQPQASATVPCNTSGERFTTMRSHKHVPWGPIGLQDHPSLGWIPDNGPTSVESSCLHNILRNVQISVGWTSRGLPTYHMCMSQAAPHLAEAILSASSKPAEARGTPTTPNSPHDVHLAVSGKCGGSLFSAPLCLKAPCRSDPITLRGPRETRLLRWLHLGRSAVYYRRTTRG